MQRRGPELVLPGGGRAQAGPLARVPAQVGHGNFELLAQDLRAVEAGDGGLGLLRQRKNKDFTNAWRLSRWRLMLSTLPYFEKTWQTA